MVVCGGDSTTNNSERCGKILAFSIGMTVTCGDRLKLLDEEEFSTQFVGWVLYCIRASLLVRVQIVSICFRRQIVG